MKQEGLDSDGKGPSKGWMMMGRYFGPEEHSRLSDQLKMTMKKI